ncbi:lipoprotein ABC transporter ATP-binding protein [Sulfobacillus thermotolerans]|uniref:Lipoprotein ABC transporter ATP-binding protein n=1 Tax=Sulfobacillus thermotolerans TaxID=338644 RepID=A0ABM6RTJ0_9FIRM|nr:lipoprotein ABC transporter ATP-binding protein [Sulfobacillus thermotolerans]
MPSEPMATLPVLALHHVSKHYQRGTEDVVALLDVSFELAPGTVTVILGPSGGGKSTLLHILGGMDRPSEGHVDVFGQDISTWSSDQLAQYRRETVGFVFQAFHLIASMTALENVELPLLLAGVPTTARRARALELLKRVGLETRANHYPGQLSGGQAQRVAIARALAANPPLILADEPTGNLDSASGEDIIRLLIALAHEDGHSVVIVTHNEEFAARADRVLRIRDGVLHGDLKQEETAPMAPTAVTPLDTPLRHVKWPALWRMAWHSLARRLSRGILTGLGIAIGVAAMILLMGLGSGLKSHVVGSVVSLGPLTAINVSPQSQTTDNGLFGPQAVVGHSQPITSRTLLTFAHLPGSRGAYANMTFLSGVTWRSRATTTALLPLPPTPLWSVNGILPKVSAGRVSSRPADILLPVSVAKALLGGKHPDIQRLIGHRVQLHLETVSGGLFSGGGLSGPAHPVGTISVTVTGLVNTGLGYVPYPTALGWMRQFSSTAHVTYPGATVLAHNLSAVNGLSSRITKMGYSTTTLSDALQSINKSFRLIELGLGAVGGIALVVAGLMIGVVMSMSVLERRREIGVLRAVGARRRDISRLFLLEALAIGLMGAVAGLAIGSGVGLLINGFVSHAAAGDTIFALPGWLIIMGLAFGGGVAVIAGAIPASHAASLNPIDALRQE